MRLIDKSVLKEWVENWFYQHKYYHPYSKSNRIPCSELYDILERMPTIDAVEVKHGEWVGFPDSFKYEHVYDKDAIVCPFCEESWNIIDNDTERFNYCPNCEANMDGEEIHNDG